MVESCLGDLVLGSHLLILHVTLSLIDSSVGNNFVSMKARQSRYFGVLKYLLFNTEAELLMG